MYKLVWKDLVVLHVKSDVLSEFPVAQSCCQGSLVQPVQVSLWVGGRMERRPQE